ncbi:MFS transporter [Actinoplanes sp. NPDC051859]|uniref:MFS transporter n=1 Tax=Actinoplanes sp. NPDC051859 TaxID=3363909 RepID=UPI0037B89C6F
MRLRSVAVLRGSRDFRLLWLGQFTSEFGSAVAFVATPMIAIAVTGSLTQAGLLGTVSYLTSWLGAVPMGHLADRVAPRRLMLACDAVRLVVSVVLAVGVTAGYLSLELLAGCAVVSALAMLGFRPAASKLLRALLPAEQLPTAVAANQVRGQLAALAGPAVGGGLFHLGRSIPLVVDAVSYAVSLCCVGSLRPAAVAPPPDTGPRSGFGYGFRLVWEMPFLRALTAYGIITNFAVSMVLFALILGPGAASGGAAIGTALSVGAIAAMVGSMVAPRLHRALGLPALLLVVVGVRLVTTLGAALLGGPVAAIVALAAVLLLQPVAGAATETARMLIVPADVYGRMSGTTSFLTSALPPIAPLLAGAVLDTAGAGWAFGIVAALFAAAGLVVAVSAAALTIGTAPVPAAHPQ